MISYRNHDVEIASRPSVDPGFSFSSQTKARSSLDAGWNLQGQRSLFLNALPPMAGLTGGGDDIPFSIALRTRPDQREEPLLKANLSRPLTAGTNGNLG